MGQQCFSLLSQQLTTIADGTTQKGFALAERKRLVKGETQSFQQAVGARELVLLD